MSEALEASEPFCATTRQTWQIRTLIVDCDGRSQSVRVIDLTVLRVPFRGNVTPRKGASAKPTRRLRDATGGEMTTRTNLIFVGGVPRSGTTLVQNVLDSHPEIHGLPEFFMNIPIAGLRGHFQELIEKGMISDICDRDEVDRRVRAFIEGFLLRDSAVGHRYVARRPRQRLRVFPSPGALSRSEVHPGAERPESGHPSTPQGRNRGPQALPLGQPERQDPPGFDRLCEARSCRGLSAIDKAPGRIYTLKYEDLVLEPVPTTRALCEYLELEWSERMLTPGEFEHQGGAGSPSIRSGTTRKTLRRNIEDASLETWKPGARASSPGPHHRSLPRVILDFALWVTSSP